jgi:hypothetical protein
MQSAAVQWSQLLIEAVQKPGIISTAYTAFHNYSIGNQILAWSQCQDRELPVGPIATFKKWKSLGRSVVKGAKAIHLCMPITIKKEKHGQDEIFQTFVLKNYWFVLSQTEGQPYQERTVNTDWSAKWRLDNL